MVHLGDQENIIISTQNTNDRKEMQKNITVESNKDERKPKDQSARIRNYDREERHPRKEDYGRRSYRSDNYNRSYQERDRFNRERHIDYARQKYREPALGRERYRAYDSQEDVKDSSEAEHASQGYSSRDKYERNARNIHHSGTKSRSKNAMHEVPAEKESSEEKELEKTVDQNSNPKLHSVERNRDSDSDRPNHRDYHIAAIGDEGSTYGRSTKRNDETRRDDKYASMEGSRHYRSRDEIDKGSESREDSRYSRRRRDPVGEERAPGVAFPPARPDSAASHRTSNSRVTAHGYPGYGDYYKSSSSSSRRAPGGEMYDPQSYYYYYYSPYFEQHPKYRDYCQNYYKHYPHQYGAAGAPHSLPDERGSVRSGRSSAAEEVKKATLNSSRAMEGAPYYDPYGLYPQHQHDTSSGDVSGRASVDIAAPRPPSQRLTPSLFSRPHTITRFTNTGQLLIVVPSGDTPSTTLTVLSLREVLQQDGESHRQIKALEAFPGPLTTEDTHKDKVVRFCEAKQQHYRDLCSSTSSKSLEQLRSRLLLWRYLAMLVRQNGKLCPADLAALLVESANEALEEEVTKSLSKLALNNEDEDKPDGEGKAIGKDGEEGGGERLTSSVSQTSLASSVHGPSTASSWDVSGAKHSRGDSSWDVSRLPRNDLSRCVPQLSQQQLEQVTQQLGELVCLGRRRDAVELAIEHRLWGHAMAIGSRMEQAVGGRVLSAFLQCLPQQDVLHTLVQQVNGKRPDVSKSYSRSRWGEWRRHLATLVTNPSPVANRDVAAVISLGDSLATSDTAAGHICYLMGGGLSVWGHKLQLLGLDPSTASPHSLDYLTSVQCTQVYEYGLNLASAALDTSDAPPAVAALGGFAKHKLRYASLLAECGFFEQAVRYCEVLAGSLACPGGVAALPVEDQVPLVAQLQELASRLKYHDRHYLLGEGEIYDMPDPQWLTNLQVYYYHLQQHQMQGQQIQQAVEDNQVVAQENHVQEPQHQLQEPSASAVEHRLQNGTHFVSSSGAPPAHEDAVTYTSPDTTEETPRASLYDTMGEENAVPREQFGGSIPMVPTFPVEDHQLREDPHQSQPAAVDTTADALQGFSFQPRMVPTSNSSSTQENHALGVESRSEAASYGEGGSEPSSPQFTPTHAPAQPSYQMMSPPLYGLPSVGASPDTSSSVHQPPQQQVPSSSAPPAPTTSNNDGASNAGGSSDASTKNDAADSEKKGLFSRIFGWKNNQAKLPDDKNPSIVWDEERKRWVNTDGTEENEAPPPPPPMDSSLPPAPAGNRAGNRRSRYVNPVDEKHIVKPAASLVPPIPVQPMMPQQPQQMMPQQPQQMMPQQPQQMMPQQPQQMMPQQPQQMMPQQPQQMMPQQPQQMMPQQPQQMMPQQPQQQPQQQMMPQEQQMSQQPNDTATDVGAVSTHAPTGRVRSDSSSIDLDDPDASASQDDTAAAAGTPMFFNPAQFQQPPQQLSAGRGRGVAANARRGRGGGPQRRVFQSSGAAPPPPRA